MAATFFFFLRPRVQVDLGQSTLVHGLGLEFRTGHPDLVTNLEVRRMTKLFPNVLKHFLPLGKGYFLCEDIIRTTFLLVDPSGRHKCRNSYSSKWKQNQRPNHICSTIHITLFFRRKITGYASTGSATHYGNHRFKALRTKKQTFSYSFYSLQLVSGASANRLFDCVVPLPGRFVSIQRTRAGLAPEKIDEGWTWEIEIEEVQVFAMV